jgi:hypothetical protein
MIGSCNGKYCLVQERITTRVEGLKTNEKTIKEVRNSSLPKRMKVER